jgi:hypothetical protein
MVDAFHAIVALVDLAGFRIQLGYSLGTGRDTAFATHTQNNAVLAALQHGSGGTSRHTPGFFAMKTRHVDICHTQQVVDQFGTDRQ